MPSATVTAVIKTPQTGVVKSLVTVTETLSDGTALTPASYELNSANSWSTTFTSALGSVLNAIQVDVNAGGFQSPPAIVPPFTVTNPAPDAPTGDAVVGFSVTGVNS